MMAFVRGVMAFSTSFGSSVNVWSSMSTYTGFAPTYEIAQLVATNVCGVVMTSSPALTFSSIIATCSADVPLLKPTACFAPQ